MDEEAVRLLQEIRDTQREHLAEYKKASQRAMELQEQAVSRQAYVTGLYRRVLLVGGTVAGLLLILLIYLLTKWGGQIL